MKLVQDVLKSQYQQLHDTYMDSHNAHVRAKGELNRFTTEVSKLVKWSRVGSTVFLSYAQEIYEVHTRKGDKNKYKEPTYKVMKAKRVICERYWRDMEQLRVDIVFNNLGEYK